MEIFTYLRNVIVEVWFQKNLPMAVMCVQLLVSLCASHAKWKAIYHAIWFDISSLHQKHLFECHFTFISCYVSLIYVILEQWSRRVFASFEERQEMRIFFSINLSFSPPLERSKKFLNLGSLFCEDQSIKRKMVDFR